MDLYGLVIVFPSNTIRQLYCIVLLDELEEEKIQKREHHNVNYDNKQIEISLQLHLCVVLTISEALSDQYFIANCTESV